MAKVHFDKSMVIRLIEHAKLAPKHQAPFGSKDPAVPALILVGDDGIYLLSNGQYPGEKPPYLAAYARECNPKTMDFDTWWAAKQEIFGGDDGAEHVPLADVEPALATYPASVTEFAMYIGGDAIGIYSFDRPKSTPAPPPKPKTRA
jgi:hypothetical protein